MREKLPKELKQAIKKFAVAQEKGRTETNAANREKTALRNTVKNYWAEHQLPIGSFIRSGGLEIRYEASETTSLDAETILKMYENKEITREQFVRMLKIDMSQAKNVLGGDQVADLEVTSIGDKPDIRISSLPVEQHDDEYIVVERRVRKKVKRSVLGQAIEDRDKPEETQAKAKRRIKIRRK